MGGGSPGCDMVWCDKRSWRCVRSWSGVDSGHKWAYSMPQPGHSTGDPSVCVQVIMRACIENYIAPLKVVHRCIPSSLPAQLFFPSEDEEVVELRKRIKLADNEAIILKDGEGKYHFR